ncbi:MAG TPA: anaerobic ribonucleoside triphosphate reductase [Candidatus Merdenecus merdavium]|nr:anaerobic ribonucleoside triphosphate reductase [Candidatus Merdenecus merdavium]
MIDTIQKRNGKIVPFDSDKIKNAISKANQAVKEDAISSGEIAVLTGKVCSKLSADVAWNVEKVQDIVEEVLIRSGHAQTAKAYILYRAEHSKIRQSESDLMDIYKRLTYADAKDEDIKRENANIDADTAMGTMLKYGSEGAKYFIDNYILPKDIALAHSNGDIHIHDKDFYMLTETCCQIDLIQLFKNGFSTGHGFLREPNSIRSYSALACIAIQSNQNEMHGGQSIPNFDYAMAQGVAKTYRKEYLRMMALYFNVKYCMDEEKAHQIMEEIEEKISIEPTMSNKDRYQEELALLSIESITGEQLVEAHQFASKEAESRTDKQTYQSMEALIHNLNTMNSRAGAQVPFSSVNYGTDTSVEGRMVIKNILKATIAGMGDGETPIFPVQIFKVKEGINYNPEDPNYDLFKLAIQTSARRLFPNFSFIDAPFNLQYYKEGDYNTEIAYMGCRTRVMSNHYDKSKEIISGRGNLSFTSINLPRLGILAEGDMEKFYELLEDRLILVKRQLLHRFKIQCSKKVRNYPFLMGQHVWIDTEDLGPDDSVSEVLKHGTLSVGFIGLAETLKALIGEHHGESKKAQELGLEIIGYMRRRMDEMAKETGLNFSLLATPAEGLSGRFVAIDQKRFGKIEGVTDRDYYTNSFHIPVYFPIKAYQKMELEAPYHALTNAGHISYVELDGDTSKNPEAFETIIRYMKELGIGYGSINHPVDRDPVCGYTGVIDEVCPRCGRRVGEPISLEKLKEIQRKYNHVPQY